MARIGWRITNVSDRRPDSRGDLHPRVVGLGDGRMLGVGEWLVFEGEIPGGLEGLCAPPEEEVGVLERAEVDLDTGEPLSPVPAPEPEIEPAPAVQEEAGPEAPPPEEISVSIHAPFPGGATGSVELPMEEIEIPYIPVKGKEKRGKGRDGKG